MRVSPHQKLILGPPGTGKTTCLLNMVNDLLDRGVATDQIAFVSFTRKAVAEARNRACDAYSLKPADLPYFKTIHSLCFHALKCKKEDLMGKDNYTEFGEWAGYKFRGALDMEDPLVPTSTEEGDMLLFLDNLSRTMQVTPEQLWETGVTTDKYALIRFCESYAKFKAHFGLLDFTDLLSKFNVRVPVKYVFIDEAQDLSKLQWAVIKVAFSQAEVVIAGDDDQSIYKWSGADLETFLNLEGEKQVLHQSYRLPKLIYASAQKIVSNIQHRYEKEYRPTSEEGVLDYATSIDYLEKPAMGTLILVRNTYLLPAVFMWLKRCGTAYTGHGGVQSVTPTHARAIRGYISLREGATVSIEEAKAVYSCIRRHKYLTKKELELKTGFVSLEDLRLPKLDWWDVLNGITVETAEYYKQLDLTTFSAPVKVHVDTIHGAKGGEADHVILLSDISKKSFIELQTTPDNEHRVAYVAATRAKKRCTIVMPNSRYSYPY